MERRAFVKGSMAAVVTLGLSPEQLLSAEAAPPKLSRAWFEARRGSCFRIANGGRWTRVRLAEVRPDRSAPELEQFAFIVVHLRGCVVS